MNTTPTHAETYKKADIAEDSAGYIDEQLLPQQLIEGGGLYGEWISPAFPYP